MRKDHSGITFVELIIAIAISTIIFGAAILFLGMAHKNYNHASAQIDLQSESQILMEQIGMSSIHPKTDTTVISAATDEVQENLIGEYVTAFTGTVNASTEKASVAVSFDMQYLEQKYTIQNEFKLRNVLR